MRITFIGTSAGEGYPGFWCACPNCAEARERGGRNLRGNTCTLIGDDMLVDMNDHFFATAPRLGLDPGRIRCLLVTHPHVDHFAPWKLIQREAPYAQQPYETQQKEISPCFSPLPTLRIYGNRFVKQALESVPDLMDNRARYRIAFHQAEPGKPFDTENAHVTPIESRHGPQKGFAYNYIIRREGKTLLYASDTGGYDESMLGILRSFRYDCVIMEGTFGTGKTSDTHMSLEKNRGFLRYMEENGLWNGAANFHLTHICPHWSPPHDRWAPLLAEEGLLVAYDGKEITV